MKFCCVGDNCIDYYVNEDIAKPGGNPVNVAVYIKQMGGDSSYVGAVGNDEFGKILVDGLKEQNVDVSNVQVQEGKTAVTEVTMDGNDRILGDYDEGVMEDFQLTDENREFIKDHDIVISGYWGNVHHEFKSFKEDGLLTAFDFATYIDSERTNETMRYIDYAFFSDGDRNEEELKELLSSLHKLGPKIVVVTRGEKGSMAFDGEKYYEFGIIPCEVIDTLGAGDSYIAGFTYAIMNGESIEESMKNGAKRSAKTIEYDGAW